MRAAVSKSVFRQRRVFVYSWIDPRHANDDKRSGSTYASRSPVQSSVRPSSGVSVEPRRRAPTQTPATRPISPVAPRQPKSRVHRRRSRSSLRMRSTMATVRAQASSTRSSVRRRWTTTIGRRDREPAARARRRADDAPSTVPARGSVRRVWRHGSQQPRDRGCIRRRSVGRSRCRLSIACKVAQCVGERIGRGGRAQNSDPQVPGGRGSEDRSGGALIAAGRAVGRAVELLYAQMLVRPDSPQAARAA